MFLEIRTYRLRPGTSAEFVRVMRDEAVPLLAGFGIEVVSCGASLVAEDGHEEAYLIRRFPTLADRDEREEAFYTSAAWTTGPRDAILSRIETYHTIVVAEDAVVTASTA